MKPITARAVLLGCRPTIPILVAAVLWLPGLSGCSAPPAPSDVGDAGPPPPHYQYAVKADFVPTEGVLPYLPEIASRGFALVLGVRPWDIGSAGFKETLATAAALGIPVKLWPLLDWKDGSWCCEDTLEPCLANIRAAVDAVRATTNSVDTIVVNEELAHPKIDQLKEDFKNGDLTAARALLLANRDPAMFVRSQAKIRALVDELHGRGYLVEVNTYPYVVDDLADGDWDIQDVINVPVSGIPWDIYSFTCYTTSYSADFHWTFGPYFPFSYGGDARSLLGGAPVEIAVGVLDSADKTAYASPAQLAADVAGVKAAGVTGIALYHAGGTTADQFGAWADALAAPAAVPDPDQGTNLMHALVESIDRSLDRVDAGPDPSDGGVTADLGR